MVMGAKPDVLGPNNWGSSQISGWSSSVGRVLKLSFSEYWKLRYLGDSGDSGIAFFINFKFSLLVNRFKTLGEGSNGFYSSACDLSTGANDCGAPAFENVAGVDK